MNNLLTEIDLSYVSVKYKTPIVYFEYKEGAELGFPEIREVISYAEKLSGQTPYVTFADARVNINVTNEGKRILTDLTNMPLFRGSAVLVKNNLHKYAANFLNYFSNPKYPFRAFTIKEEAIDWLLTLPLD